MILSPNQFQHYVDFFNEHDQETIVNSVPNKECWEWMADNIPWFECPDKDIERVYYFRWWVFRKHLKRTPSGFVITEFLPEVAHARKHNTIACAPGLHIEEGRWLRDRRYVSDYIRFWFSAEGEPRQYSNWLASAVLSYCQATDDFELCASLLDSLIANYHAWEAGNLHESGLFWSHDGNDGGEYSISGDGLRPTLNSYMYGDAVAISKLAARSGRSDVSADFENRANQLRGLVQEKLWDPKTCFFKTISVSSRDAVVNCWDFSSVESARNVREIYGYLPWKFALPSPGHEMAWRQLIDEQGFAAPYGPTTAEQRHPRFMKYRVKRCQWDGPSWPFTTSLTLGALARLLREYEQDVVGKHDYFNLIRTYTLSQRRMLPYGEEVPWIDENFHPHSGIWLARAIALEGRCPVVRDMNHALVRGKDYNHSSYCDHIIGGLVGFQPGGDGSLTIDPLLSNGTWDWFCLDGIHYGDKQVTVLYDKTGAKYGRGRGLRVFANGKEIGFSHELSTLTGTTIRLLEQTATNEDEKPRA